MRRLRLGDKLLRVRDEPDPPPPGFPADRDRPPLVCLHGAGMSSVVFVDLVRRVSRSLQRRTLAPDLPGHGQSDPWHPPISIDGYRDAVGTVCSQLGIGRAVLLGHSMGAAVALRCALSYPDRVAGLVLCNSAGSLPVSEDLFALLESVLSSPPDSAAALGEDAARPSGISEPMPDSMAELMFSPHTLPDVRARWQAVLTGAHRDVVIGDFRACAAFDVRAALPGLRVPTLVVCGADDLMISPRRSQGTLGKIPGARVEIIPRTGHMTHLEAPDAFHDLLADFLKTV